ncbi:MAG: hypothetical protein LBT06_17560 [Hungatella sp.]|nr:hypothetical protein [Hungatella sp.]
MSGNIEKVYIKIKDKLESINSIISRLEKEIRELTKEIRYNDKKAIENNKCLDMNKTRQDNENNKSYFLKILGIPIFILFIMSVFLYNFYNYKNKNSLVVISGMPQDFVCNNFTGKIVMRPSFIEIKNGNLVNQNYLKAIIDGQTFEVKPGDLKIQFDSNKHIDKYGYPYGNYFNTEGRHIFFSTSLSSEYYVYADKLSIIRNSNVFEYNINNLLPIKSQYNQIQVENFRTEAPIQIQDQDTLKCEGGIYVYINGKDIVENYQTNKDIKLCNMQTGIPIGFDLAVSKGTFYFDVANGISLNGIIESFFGKTGIDDGKMVFTSLNEQKGYDIGGANLFGDGSSLNLSYDFNNDINQINISGKINTLEFSGVNIMEGWRTFIYSNLTSIFSAVIAAILSAFILSSFDKKNH